MANVNLLVPLLPSNAVKAPPARVPGQVQERAQVAQEEIPAWAYAVSLAGGVIGAYHGYKRNDSVGWAIVWSFLGSAFPFITIPVAAAQGLGTRAPK